MPKPKVLVTRKLTGSVEDRLASDYDVVLNPSDRPMTAPELSAAMRSCDALVPTVSDQLNAACLKLGGRTVRMIANVGVGYTTSTLPPLERRA